MGFLRKFWNMLFIAFGMFLIAFSVHGMLKNGFYISWRGNVGQLEAGFLPFVFLMGCGYIGYACFDWFIRKER